MKLDFVFRIVNKLTQKPPFCSAVIVAAGSSQRMGGVDKLFLEIDGIPVIVHAVMAFQRSSCIHEIVVVTRQDSLEPTVELCEKYGLTKVSKVVVGGSTRSESVLNGLTAISKNAVLAAIHDAARPCVDVALIEKTVLKAEKHKAAAPAIPITSTMKMIKNDIILETINRDDYVEIQTPQVFNADLIKGALTDVIKKDLVVTDDCMALELLGVRVYTTDGSTNNIKLTDLDDITIARAIFSQNAGSDSR